MKVVLDTNVLLAAFAARGLCEALLEACLESHEIIISQHILDEVREHLIRKLKVPPRQAGATVRFLKEVAVIVEPVKVPKDACRDRTDLPVIGTALAAGADCLVSGDKDLLALGRFENIPILSPRAFYDSLR